MSTTIRANDPFDDYTNPLFTVIQAEAMMCVWEHMDSIHQINHALDEKHPMIEVWEDHGAATMRQLAMRLGVIFEDAYKAAIHEVPERWDGYAYDWEVIPAMFGACVWDIERGTVEVPDDADLIRAVDGECSPPVEYDNAPEHDPNDPSLIP
jgi:hypothetical protein